MKHLYFLISALTLIISCQSTLETKEVAPKENPNEGLSFNGVESVGSVSATTAKISWTSHSDAMNYFIFNTAVTPKVLLATVSAPASEHTLIGLDPQKNYKIMVRAQDSGGLIDNNSRVTSFTTLSTGNYRSLIMSDNPSGYWRLGDVSSTAHDETNDANHGTINGSIGYSSLGAIQDDGDTALTFDGTTTSISGIGTVSSYSFIHSTGVFTIELWAKLQNYSLAADHPLIANEGTGSGRGFHFTLLNSDGKKRFYLAIYRAAGGGAANIFTIYSPANTVIDNDWHHYAATGDGKDIKLYFDGTLVSTRTIDYTLPSGNAGNKLGIAGYQSGGGTTIYPGIKGDMDEVVIYNKTLSPDKIKARIKESGR